MRGPRIKVKGEDAIYHCMNRIVSEAYLLGDEEKRFIINLMWKVANYCEVDIYNYIMMDNHYHLMVWVPKKVTLTPEQLLKKLIVFYGKSHIKVKEFERAMKAKDGSVRTLKYRHMKIIGDISGFCKLFNQRFSTWYNSKRGRNGTLWRGRFKSLVVEDVYDPRMTLSAYMTLNSVRADLSEDPAEYVYSAYSAALAGDERCREGICRTAGVEDWGEASRLYRWYVLEEGRNDRKGNGNVIKGELLQEMEDNGGELPRAKLLRLKIRYFSDGVVLGRTEYVEKIFERFRSQFGKRRRTGSREMRGGSWGELRVLRDLKKQVFG